MRNFLPIYKRLVYMVYAFLLSMVVPVRAPHFYTTQQCILRSHFRQGRMIGGAMRKLGNTGPLTCIRECLLRRSCVSISYNTEGPCLLQYARASLSNPLYGLDNAWQYTEKPDMYGMVNTYPCNDAVCGENERCEVLHDKSVFCSITECTKPPEGIFRSWRTYASTTRAVGDVREYFCRHGAFLNVATYTCKQDGSWGITDISPQNINECNKRECQKNEDFLYIKETNGCYRFFNESKTHSQAEEYCRSSFRHGHLFLADSSEKIDALIHDVISLSRLGFAVLYSWTDGIYQSNISLFEINTWKGPVLVQKLWTLKEYANIVFQQQEGCLRLVPVLNEMQLHDCSVKSFFVCEIEIELWRFEGKH